MNDTPSQTVGPFFSIGLRWLDGLGDGPLELHGHVLDGEGVGVGDAVVECISGGALRRSMTAPDGAYRLRVEPASSRGGPPFVEVSVFARGLLQRVLTRAYLADGRDAVLNAVSPDRRPTLLADVEAARTSARFDIHLQGERETVFLAW